MDQFHRTCRAVAPAILSLLLIASMLCVCGTAKAEVYSAGTNHSCCPGNDTGEDKSPHREHRSDCHHCGQSQLVPDEISGRITPQLISVSWMLASEGFIGSHYSTHMVLAPIQGYVAVLYPTPPLFSLKCAFLI